ncbi:hypothetical protein E2C01_098081 [Portunus trituberculatus]|uniref:Uncharacterized protein n=1 Tax=Portunus trituberculatus TaxID=210409 RepID=A0A5B7K7B5_PORTR|nr:hypothetical protein [Portunus trituberculatus]
MTEAVSILARSRQLEELLHLTNRNERTLPSICHRRCILPQEKGYTPSPPPPPQDLCPDTTEEKRQTTRVTFLVLCSEIVFAVLY